jgi:hypothetical protein
MIKSGLVFQTFHLQIKSLTMGMRIMKSLKVIKLKQVNLSSIAMQSRLGNEETVCYFWPEEAGVWGERPGGEGQDEGGLVTVMARGRLAKQEMCALDCTTECETQQELGQKEIKDCSKVCLDEVKLLQRGHLPNSLLGSTTPSARKRKLEVVSSSIPYPSSLS